jgi:selenocysteine lyase/cysteine desulfurase
MKRSVQYHNHAGTSWPKPDAVLQAAERATMALPAEWGRLFEDAHRGVARAFGVGPERMLITPSCTQALAVAIADLPWEGGDRILSSQMEHHALVRPLAKLQGVETLHLPRGQAGPIDLNQVEEQLKSGGVRLVAMSMASNVSGELLPWKALVELSHEYGALCLLDGAQVAGWHPLDLLELGVDLFAFAGHKGPQGPSGAGGLYLREGLVMDTPGARCGLDSCDDGPSYCDTGSVNLPALCGLAAGLAWMAREQPLEGVLAALSALRDGLTQIPGVRVLGAAPGVPTCSVVLQGMTAAEASAKLRSAGVVASGGIQCAPMAHEALGTDPNGTLRLSLGPKQGTAEAQALLSAVQGLAGQSA